MRLSLILFAILSVMAASVAGYAFWPQLPLPADTKADRVVVLKSQRKLLLKQGAKTLREYRIALGFSPVGTKQAEGDGKTPEGSYIIDYRNPNSQFYRSLHISYPSAQDIARARKRGVKPGGMIMIHGLGNEAGAIGALHTLRDWTLGCIAVTNEEIEEIWNLVADGTPIEILP